MGRFVPVRTLEAAALVVGFAGLLGVALLRLQPVPVPPPLVVPPPGRAAAGIDTSSYQHPEGAKIDWLAVRAAGVSYAYVKATEGSDLVDPWFRRDWAGVAAAGLYRGAYHYSRPEPGSAVGDADHFLDVVGRLNRPGDLPPALDVEQSGGMDPDALAAWVADWVAEVRQRTDRTPVIYTRSSFWNAEMGGTVRFSGAPLWVASYTTAGDPGPPFGGWPTWTLWQWSPSGGVDGVSGQVDQDRLAGGGPALAALAVGRTASP